MALADYGYKRKITIDHTKFDATETDYPAMSKFYSDSSVSAWSLNFAATNGYAVGNIVKNDNAYFKCTTSDTTKEPRVTTSWQDDWHWLGDEFDFTKIQSDGKDIRFTASDESTLLDYERELIETTTQPYQLVIHVRIPSVSLSVDTDYYMYYDYASETVDGENKTGVWDSNFVMVQHMGTSLSDSTINGNDGTNNGSTVVDGFNGKARSFDGSNDYIQITENTTLNSSEYTVTLLSKLNVDLASQPSSFPTLFSKIDGKSGYSAYYSAPSNTLVHLFGGGANNEYTIDTTITDYNTYSFLHNGTYGKTFNNGSLKDTAEVSHTTGSGDMLIGCYEGTVDFINARIDEVRISNIARSDAWIKADDANLRTWDLQSIGVEEAVSTGNSLFFAFNF
jgi:hypothetical protein